MSVTSQRHGIHPIMSWVNQHLIIFSLHSPIASMPIPVLSGLKRWIINSSQQQTTHTQFKIKPFDAKLYKPRPLEIDNAWANFHNWPHSILPSSRQVQHYPPIFSFFELMDLSESPILFWRFTLIRCIPNRSFLVTQLTHGYCIYENSNPFEYYLGSYPRITRWYVKHTHQFCSRS